MAVKEIKDMGASVLTRLKKQAKETGINYQTCLQLFAQEELQHRGTPYEKDSMEQIRAFDQNEFLQKLWNNYNPGPGLEKPDFSSVLVQINRFISPVYGALLREDEFFGMWSSKENVWK